MTAEGVRYVVVFAAFVGVALLYHIGKTLDRIETILLDRLPDEDEHCAEETKRPSSQGEGLASLRPRQRQAPHEAIPAQSPTEENGRLG